MTHSDSTPPRTPIELSIGDALKIVRKEKGYTGRQMAEWLGISRTHYLALESNRQPNPSLRTIWPLLQEYCRLETVQECQRGTDEPHYHLRSKEMAR